MASSSMTKNISKTVEESIKGDGIWIFSDTECKTDKKLCYTWTTLFQAFQDKDFVMLLQNDASTELSKEVYKNIIKSGLLRATVKTRILSCPDVIEWITRKIDHQHRSILNAEGKDVANYKPSLINQIYHLKEATVKISPDWLKQKSESADMLTILKGWWSEGNFRSKPANVEWKTSKFRKSIQIIVIFLSRVFGKKDSSIFLDKRIPIIYQIIKSGSTLNWGELISSSLDLQLKKAQKEHEFFMSSYLLDVMCASREYPSLGWKWKSDLSSIHVYCKMLWENKYKEDCELICNGLFATIY